MKKRQSTSNNIGTIHDSRGFPDIFKRKANVRNFAGLYNPGGPKEDSEQLVFMKEKYRIGDGEKSQASKNIERTVRMHSQKANTYLLKNRAMHSVNPSVEKIAYSKLSDKGASRCEGASPFE